MKTENVNNYKTITHYSYRADKNTKKLVKPEVAEHYNSLKRDLAASSVVPLLAVGWMSDNVLNKTNFGKKHGFIVGILATIAAAAPIATFSRITSLKMGRVFKNAKDYTDIEQKQELPKKD